MSFCLSYQNSAGLHLANALFGLKGQTFKVLESSGAFDSCDYPANAVSQTTEVLHQL